MNTPADPEPVRDESKPRELVASPALVPRVDIADEGFGAGAAEASGHGRTTGFSTYLHALRRRWLPACLLGVFCGAAAGLGAWFLQAPQYSARALLRVSATEKQLVFPTVDRAQATSFEIYKGTQQQLLKSEFVLIASLRDPRIDKLDAIKQQQDPVRWLADQIQVSFPSNAEIMVVSLRHDNPLAAAALVNAVVDAYLKEVVDADRNQRTARLSELQKIYEDKQEQVRSKRTELRGLVEKVGSGDSGALALKQQSAWQQFGELRRQLLQVQFDIRRLRAELRAKQGTAPGEQASEVSAVELETLVQSDPTASRCAAELSEITKMVAEQKARAATKEIGDAYTGKYEQYRVALEKQLEERKRQILTALQARTVAARKSQLAQLESQIAVLTEQEKELTQELEACRVEAGEVGGSSIDAEMKRAEIKSLEDVLNPIAEECERLRVEKDTAPRITLWQRAAPPGSPDTANRLQLTLLGALAGLLLPMVGIVLWDVRSQRINSSAEVAGGLGLRAIGTIPLIPARVIRGVPSRRPTQRRWRAILDEALGSITARLLHDAQREADSDAARTILVTSAVRGEGKTTLASQLGMRLARTGHRTLLVDFDFRRPALDTVFGVPLEPGLGDLLRGDSDLDAAVHPTPTENLFVLAAGRWSGDSLGVLSNGATESLFDTLRSQFDFVLVDGSPILPVADTRVISRHVDGVLLSILRDVSRGPKVLAACEILDAFGVRLLGAVMTGSATDAYYGDLQYAEDLPG